MRHLYLGCAVAALLAPVAGLHAQETSATIRGQVVSDSGGALPNATVVIVHVPSGARTTVTTDAGGAFNATGLRLGGPFTVEVSAAGYDSATANLDNLLSGSPQRISVQLYPIATTITVTANRTLRSSITIASGPATVLNAAQIAGVASINRDIRDLARRDPFVTLDATNSRAISIAGQNNRFNRINVDGIAFGDPFGLNNGGLASARGPVPLDAIAEFSVEVAPADIVQGNFQGGVINTQLKSGTNQFHGQGFFTYTGDGISGKHTKAINVSRIFHDNNWGVQLTGPIVKDKLFFAVTYEKLRASTPADVGVAGEGFANSIPGLTRTSHTQNIAAGQTIPTGCTLSSGISYTCTGGLDTIRNIAKGAPYNYDPLDVASSVPEKDDKLVAKIDWNIADGHRANLTYIYAKNSQLANQTPISTLSATNPTLSLQSNNYQATEANHYGVLEFNDNWSDVFSTRARVTYNDYKRGQIPYNGRTFGDFTVCLDSIQTGSVSSCTSGTPRVEFGPDLSRQANELRVKRSSVELQAQIKMDGHAVKLIAERRDERFNNLFQQNASGTFYFDSIQDFINGRAGSLTLAAPVNGDINSVRAIFKQTEYTFGIQDVWDASPDLTLIYGFRYDLYAGSDRPPLNANFVARNGFGNNATLNGRGLFQPRFGFTFSPGESLRLRGSAGRYSGGSPNVWISNSFSNPGTLVNQGTFTRTADVNGATACTGTRDFGGFTAQQLCAQALDNVDGGGPAIPSVVSQFLAQGLSQLSVTNALDPNFKLPSQWRYAISGDYKVPFGADNSFSIGGDAVYSKVDNGQSWTDLRSRPNTVNGTLPDGRPRYQQTVNTLGNNGASITDNNQDVLLFNSTKGYSVNLVARARAEFGFGLSAFGSYTWQRAKDVNSGTSSVALSNYSQTAASDPNQSAYGTSNYQIDNTFKLGIGYRHNFFADAATRIDLFFESRAGQRYSYTFADTTSGRSAVFGTTGTNNRYLMYVPNVATLTSDPKAAYAAGFDFTGFQNFIQNSALRDFQGSIAPKNLGRSPRFNKLDLHFGQEIPLPHGFKVEGFVDVENVLNLINRDWGQLSQVGFPYYATIVNVACNNGNSLSAACNQYTYSNFKTPAQSVFTAPSLWQIRVGARIKF